MDQFAFLDMKGRRVLICGPGERMRGLVSLFKSLEADVYVEFLKEPSKEDLEYCESLGCEIEVLKNEDPNLFYWSYSTGRKDLIIVACDDLETNNKFLYQAFIYDYKGLRLSTTPSPYVNALLPAFEEVDGNYVCVSKPNAGDILQEGLLKAVLKSIPELSPQNKGDPRFTETF